MGKKESKNQINYTIRNYQNPISGALYWHSIILFGRIRTQSNQKDGQSFNFTGPLDTQFVRVLCNGNRGYNTSNGMIRTTISQPELGSIMISIETTPSSLLNNVTKVCVSLENISDNPLNYLISPDILNFC